MRNFAKNETTLRHAFTGCPERLEATIFGVPQVLQRNGMSTYTIGVNKFELRADGLIFNDVWIRGSHLLAILEPEGPRVRWELVAER